MKGCDHVTYVIDVILHHVWIERQCDGPEAGIFSVRKISQSISEVSKAGLQMQRHRIVFFGANSMRGQIRNQFSFSLCLNYINVVDSGGISQAFDYSRGSDLGI